MALALAMERRSIPPTLHHWTSVSPKRSSDPAPKLSRDWHTFEANPPATKGFLKDSGVLRPPQKSIMSTGVLKTSPRGHLGSGSNIWRSEGCRKASDWRNEPPMMLMMLAPLTSIISITAAPFLHEAVRGGWGGLGRIARSWTQPLKFLGLGVQGQVLRWRGSTQPPAVNQMLPAPVMEDNIFQPDMLEYWCDFEHPSVS